MSFSVGGFGSGPERRGPSEEPLSILVIADCSGRAARGIRKPLAGRRAQPVDVDRLERVMASWQARVRTPWLEPSGEPLWLEPRSLDDLHPDRLLERLAPLAELGTLRTELATDAGAAARLSALLEAGRPAPEAGERPAAAAGESGSDLLSRLLGSAASTEPARADAPAVTGHVDLDRFIRSVVRNTGVETTSPSRPSSVATAALAATAEAEVAERLRRLLSDPAFRRLEASWRGIDGLCRHNPDDELVRVSVMDASFEELGLHPEGVAELLAASLPSLLLLDHQLSADSAELGALVGLLEPCRAHGVSVLMGAHPELAGCAHFAEVSQPHDNERVLSEEARSAWAAVQDARQRGARLALALPRFLLRQPYGAAGEPIESFAFEELGDPADHDAFPWGNGAYLLARALGIQRAGERGAHPDGSIDVRELPIVYLESDPGDGVESRIKPNAEAWLSERALGQLRAAGFSVLSGVRDTDRIRVYP